MSTSQPRSDVGRVKRTSIVLQPDHPQSYPPVYSRLVGVLVEPLSEQNGLLKFLWNEDHSKLLNSQDTAHTVVDCKVRDSDITMQLDTQTGGLIHTFTTTFE